MQVPKKIHIPVQFVNKDSIIQSKHVEFRHSSSKQSSKADNLIEKVAVITEGNQDLLEIRKETSEETFVGVTSHPCSQ